MTSDSMGASGDIRKHRWLFWGEGWGLFGVFAVVGGIAIFLAHLLWPEGRWTVAVFAITLMLLFGYLEWRYQQGHEDRLGDNFYYLGLTYTLVSVAHALYVFTSVDGVDKLVADFSIALLTTLAGIIGRVLLYEKHAERTRTSHASERIDKLRLEIGGAIAEIVEFKGQMRKVLERLSAHVANDATTMFNAVKSVATEVEQSGKAINISLRKGSTELDKAFERIAEGSRILGEHTVALNQQVDALHSVSGALAQTTSGINMVLEDHGQAINSLVQMEEISLQNVSDKIAALAGPVTALAGSIAQLHKETNGASDALVSFKNGVDPTAAKDSLAGVTRRQRS